MTCTLQTYCADISKQIFPEMKLRGLVPNFHINVQYLWAIYCTVYIPTIGPPILLKEV